MPQGFEVVCENLLKIKDTCNVYLIKDNNRAIAIDFGSGNWLKKLPAVGIDKIEHVFLTHPHSDQCFGLGAIDGFDFIVHAPAGADVFLDPCRREQFLATDRFSRGCPDSYSVPPEPIEGIKYDIAGFTDMYWHNKRIRFLSTPGHTAFAVSVLVDIAERQVVFCGDAAYADATVWHPFNLEPDHWTGRAILASWEGIKRLAGLRIDLLCPSHGETIEGNPNKMLGQLADKLLAFYESKGSISPDEPDDYFEPEAVYNYPAQRILPNLYHFGMNGYLLVSKNKQALVVDPWKQDFNALDKLLDGPLKGIKITAAVASHYHLDHCDGFSELKEKYGAKIYLHPIFAKILAEPEQYYMPWLPPEPSMADEVWPKEGLWRWNEYEFSVGHFPGQTWHHCGFMTVVNGRKVFFGGDSFQPNSRWNATGGFCAYNGGRFEDGFVKSAQKILDWSPDIIAAGHGTYFQFNRSKFEKIIHWAQKTQQSIRSLCPEGDIKGQYFDLSGSAGPEGLYGWIVED